MKEKINRTVKETYSEQWKIQFKSGMISIWNNKLVTYWTLWVGDTVLSFLRINLAVMCTVYWKVEWSKKGEWKNKGTGEENNVDGKKYKDATEANTRNI